MIKAISAVVSKLNSIVTNPQRCLWLLLPAILACMIATTTGCHTPSQCPILQALTGGRIPSPLPPEGDSYKVVGYRDGLRFYVIQYNDNLYRGGDILSPAGADALKNHGIKTIISVTPSDQERALAKEYGFKLVEIPFGQNDLSKGQLDKFLAAVSDNPGPIYVHCFGGEVRAGILLAHYRIHREGWTCDKAVEEYRRLDANFWDSLTLVQTLKDNAAM